MHLQDNEADLVALLVGLIKIALVGDGEGVHEVVRWQADARDRQKRFAQGADVLQRRFDDLWVVAVKSAEADAAVRRDETVNPMLPTMCPASRDQLRADPFDLSTAVQAIRETASFG